jgi:pantoate--beta-alanine ligase
MPEVLVSPEAVFEWSKKARRENQSIGFVPTMGALHRGHATLLEAARRENDRLVASIFVNPLQFDRSEDLARYPRTWDADLEICRRSGVDLLFAPAPAALYPQEQLTFVESPVLSAHLCGAHRPGHFRGVATVVLKLFNIVQPDRAYFGRKDAQQLAIIQRMVKDLNVPVRIVPVETVREADGLALSSRNQHLTPAERETAPVLARALRRAVELIDAGERSAASVRERVLPLFAPYPNARVEYFEIVDPDTLTPVPQVGESALIAGAMWLGSTRLIDNILWCGTAERA